MVRKILKWAGIVLGGIVLILTAFYGYVYYNTEARANKVYEVKIQKLTIPTDSISLAKGEHVATIRGCKGCHSADLSGGGAFLNDESPLGVLYISNITGGKGGISYTDEDWIRALRHGLGKDNRSLWFMPSHEIYHLSNQDMANLIGYVRTRPPVDKSIPAKSLKPLGRLITFLDKFPLFPAEKIDHNAVPVDEVTPGINPEYGKYIALACSGCHSPNFKGAASHGPGQPPIPDISSTGNPGKWTSEQFVSLFTTGIRPNGKPLDKAMPWKEFTLTNNELRAVYTYLHGLP